MRKYTDPIASSVFRRVHSAPTFRVLRQQILPEPMQGTCAESPSADTVRQPHSAKGIRSAETIAYQDASEHISPVASVCGAIRFCLNVAGCHHRSWHMEPNATASRCRRCGAWRRPGYPLRGDITPRGASSLRRLPRLTVARKRSCGRSIAEGWRLSSMAGTDTKGFWRCKRHV